MKNTCKNKAVVPTETPKEDKLVESAVLMFKSSAGECSSVCLWKLMQCFLFFKVRKISVIFPAFLLDMKDMTEGVCPLVRQLAAFSMDVCFPLVIP